MFPYVSMFLKKSLLGSFVSFAGKKPILSPILFTKKSRKDGKAQSPFFFGGFSGLKKTPW
ncbi:MAG: hypothetical protein C0433_00370 [Cyclobacterium sp.]|nr:hypothetical protein [Cyclobacterium sp.]